MEDVLDRVGRDIFTSGSLRDRIEPVRDPAGGGGGGSIYHPSVSDVSDVPELSDPSGRSSSSTGETGTLVIVGQLAQA